MRYFTKTRLGGGGPPPIRGHPAGGIAQRSAQRRAAVRNASWPPCSKGGHGGDTTAPPSTLPLASQDPCTLRVAWRQGAMRTVQCASRRKPVGGVLALKPVFRGAMPSFRPCPLGAFRVSTTPLVPFAPPPPKGRRPPRLAPRGCRAPSGGYLLWPKASGAPKKPRDCWCGGGATDTDSKRCWGLPFGVVAKYCCCPKSRGLRLRPRVVGVPTWHPEGELGAGPSGQARSVHPLKAPRRRSRRIDSGSSP